MMDLNQENSTIGNLVMLVFSVGAVIILHLTTDFSTLERILIAGLVGIVARFIAFLIVPAPRSKGARE